MARGIVVVGSLMMDLVVRAPRLPEVGESLLAHDLQTFIGGKGGNQALAALRAGPEPVSIVGRVGRDAFGEQIVAALEGAGLDCRHISRDEEIGTGVAVPIVFDDGRNSIFAIPKANLRLGRREIEAAGDAIRSARMLLVQFEVGMEATLRAMEIAHEAGVRVLLNPAPIAPYPPQVLALATYVVVNEVEAAALAPGADGDHLAEARLLMEQGPAAVFVTLGEHGSIVVSEGLAEFVASFAVESVDSVGAGDAYCGALAVALVEVQGLVAAAKFASAAGACSVRRAGAAASLPERAEIEAMLVGRIRTG
ncbi:MAG: ribokinase [Anaerolineaceae bacterium]